MGTARDCATTLEQTVRQLADAFRGVDVLRWFIVESDSADRTPAVLESLSSRMPGFRHLCAGRLASRIPLRTARIAWCRNLCLRYLDSIDPDGQVDLAVMADLDGINEGITQAAIAQCWDVPDWDVCLPNRIGLYFDLYALRHPSWCPDDCWRRFFDLVDAGVAVDAAYASVVASRRITIEPSAAPIEVESAFGGLGLYRRAALRGASYVGVTDDGFEVCEHVALHEHIRSRGGRILINPAFVNGTSREFGEFSLSARRLLLRRLIAGIRSSRLGGRMIDLYRTRRAGRTLPYPPLPDTLSG